jgi:hypothetical protein
MTPFASRADLQYIAAFVAGILAGVVSSVAAQLVAFLWPFPAVVSNTRDFEYHISFSNSAVCAVILAVYAALFFAMTRAMKYYWSAQPRPQGVKLGAAIATLLFALMILPSFSFVPGAPMTSDFGAWEEVLSWIGVGLFYVFGWFFANHSGVAQKAAK